MNKLIIALLTASLFSISNLQAQLLSGYVTDSANHKAIAGAAIYFPQLQLSAATDSAGFYKISGLTNGTYTIEAQSLGYTSVIKQVTVSGSVKLNFALVVSTSSIQEIVVTSLGNVTNTFQSPVPVSIVTHNTILQESSTNAIDEIASLPGVYEITEGPGISKPEINGLGYNRVLTLFDGERQEDMQWGDEHGILIDPYVIYEAEIIRGAASLQFGANAVAGVVSFKSEPFAENGTVQGSVLSEYQTNNGLIGNSFDIGGNNNGFVWDLRAADEEAHCYWDPKDGYVLGTAFTQSDIRAVIGLNKKWGYSRLSVSILHRQVEVPDGNRDSTGRFEFDFPQNGQIYPNTSNFLSYSPTISGYQVLDHDAVWWQNRFNVGKGQIEANIGYTQSTRQEVDSGTVGEESMTVHDIPYSFKYQIENNSGLKFTAGINGMYEFNKNFPEPPAPYIGYFELPNYNLFDIGGYAIVEKDFKHLTLSGGLRYDFRTVTVDGMYLSNYATAQQEQVSAGTPGAYTEFLPFSNSYTGPSASIGASYQLPLNNYVKINFAKSYRAPAINELTSNALNFGANAYELGNTNLKAESGYEVDLAYGNNGRDVNFEVDGFYNYINNFIFTDRLAAKNGGDSVILGYPVFQFLSNKAIIAGVTAYFNIHPADTKWIEIDNGFTYIYSYLPGQTDSTNRVPFTPAPRLTSQVKLKLNDKHNSILGSTYFELGLTKYWAQANIYSALYTELPSDAYTLYKAGVGTNFVNKKTRRVICSLFINCTNLLNIAYIDHLSHNQYFLAHGGGIVTVTQPSQGIYNMGRNIGFKFVFPIGGGKVPNSESVTNDN